MDILVPRAEKFYLINDILKHKPDIIFVAMGSPESRVSNG